MAEESTVHDVKALGREEQDALRTLWQAVRRTQTVHGYDAAHWYESYRMLADAISTHLARYCHDDDVAEEAILIEAVEEAGALLSALPQEFDPQRRPT